MGVEQPSGTVALVFTDIEGSTSLLEELGVEAYRVALATHRDVVRAACARHDGYEVNNEGDAFFFAFSSTPAAVSAVAEAMEGLEHGPILIRVGIHTGQPELDPPDYVGIDVHRAARITSAGHGGQVLLSKASRDLLDGVEVRDLGEHWFKDLAAAERVFQLGEKEFPPIRSLYRTNLPVPATPFLGREAELAAIAALLSEEGARVLSLVGPGGTGKTRLALQAAAEAAGAFPDGVWWVALAPLRDPTLVLAAIATEVGVSESPDRSPVEDLANGLAGRRLLVFIDNVEHLLPAAATEINAFVAACPTVTTVVTTRERLQVPGERVYLVPTMSETDGMALFRSRAAEAGVDLVASNELLTLCARLDNLPLALELAAARTMVFSPQQLLDRLAQRLDLLKGGRGTDARQETLRATIAWSHDLLSPREQRLFRRLSVFAGGCSFDSAEQVAGADPDTLQSLLDKSLLRRRDGSAGPRFGMLETIRQYADDQLDASGDRPALMERFATWAVSEAERAEPHLRGPDQLVWMAVLDDELANFRTALAYLLDCGETDRSLRLINALAWHLQRRGRVSELGGSLDQALAFPPGDPSIRCRALMWLGTSTYFSRGRDVERLIREALAISRAIGDPRLEGYAREMLALTLIDVLSDSHTTDATDEPLELLRQAGVLFDDAGATDDAARLAINEATALLALGLIDEALRVSDDAVARTRRQGNRHGIAVALLVRVDALARLDRAGEAAGSLLEAVGLLREVGEIELSDGYGFGLAATIAAASGDVELAARLIGVLDAVWERLEYTPYPVDLHLRDRVVAEIEPHLGRERLHAARADGQALDAEASLALAETVARDAAAAD